MRARHIAVLIGAAALIGGAATAAQAADAAKGVDFSVRAEPAASPVVSGKTVNLDARRGRWGVTLNMQQPDTRQSTLNDVAAGAYFRITPSLRVGGAVALGDQQLQPGARTPTPDEGLPRVRLETKFKF
ncbi:NtrZ family periplasmic regulatory protein [Phenylobacterium soli]|uniref:NtrZ family periplasmic regulatory protein n=1 Tax=Phenylobacterium soli TaxID=2170551 RepID=UPI001058212E|nr:hypothetical protein [Phenylobacterium soli]